MNYVLFILKAAYHEFEERLGRTPSPKGAKTALVTSTIGRAVGTFRVSDIHKECPGVSIDLIRHVLKTLRSEGQVECLGRGQNAQWRKVLQAQKRMGNT